MIKVPQADNRGGRGRGGQVGSEWTRTGSTATPWISM